MQMPQDNPRIQNPRTEIADDESTRAETLRAEQPWAAAAKLPFGEFGLKNIKTGLRMQKEMFDVVQDIGRDWVARASSEAEMVLTLPNRLKDARSPSDAMSAYGLWLSDWLRMCSEDGHRLVTDGQKIVDTSVRCFGGFSPAVTG
jgi:hypothetical protein